MEGSAFEDKVAAKAPIQWWEPKKVPLIHQDMEYNVSYAKNTYSSVTETPLRGFSRGAGGLIYSHALTPVPRLAPTPSFAPGTPGLTHWQLVGSEYSRRFTWSRPQTSWTAERQACTMSHKNTVQFLPSSSLAQDGPRPYKEFGKGCSLRGHYTLPRGNALGGRPATSAAPRQHDAPWLTAATSGTSRLTKLGALPASTLPGAT